jgi:hypothetical protein
MNIGIILSNHENDRVNKLRLFTFNAIKAAPSQNNYTIASDVPLDFTLEFKNDICITNANKFVKIIDNSLENSNLENEDLKVSVASSQEVKTLTNEIKSTYKNYKDTDFESWLSNHISPTNHYWAYNSESLNFVLPPDTDCIITVSSGLLPLNLISQLDKPCTVTLVDINNNCLEFQRYLINNIDRLKSIKSYKELIKNFSIEYRVDPIGNLTDIDKIESIIEIINHKKRIIKQCSINYVIGDLREPNEIIVQNLRSSKNPLVYFSNIFSYVPTLFGNNSEKDFVLFLNMLLGANLNVKWHGDTPNRICSSNLMKQSQDEYHWKVNIDLPYKDFLEEVSILESKNLFVKHRTKDGHKGVYFNHGWSSFCIHGLAYDMTQGPEQYGYTEETAPYDYTPEALEYCPKLVNWFKENAFRKKYHRVRIMKLDPGGIVGLHNDNPNSKASATNMAINNPVGCEMHFLNRNYQYLGLVPWTDGDVYKIQIGLNHYVVNKSNENRYHMIIHGTGGTL